MAADVHQQIMPLERKFSLQDSPRSPTVLPWDRFSNWLHCACVVTFDLELGQAMELVYPGHVKLTEREKINICYLSFPDSNSGCMGDTKFHFRIRQCPGRKNHILAHDDFNRECPASLQIDNAYYYGYVYFRQTKDKSIRRGYFQKSLVLVSKLPFIPLLEHMVEIMAPEYFDNGEPSLEAACHDIDQWPEPTPGETLNLPLMGSVVQVRIPSRSDKVIGAVQTKTHTVPQIPVNHVLQSIHETDLFSAFQPVLQHLQLMWELVLTGEPVVVMASSPTLCANAVQALVSIIWPLKYCSDYRPYFTIHDSEFKEYTTKTQAPPAVILGVTNPFFAKTLQHWPNIVRIGETSGDGVYTRYKPYLSKDKTILKRLSKGIQLKRPVEVQSAMLRRFLLELTQSFMIPLERYMASLMPLQRNISPHKGPPVLKPFNVEEFLKTLDHSGPQLTSGLKGDWIGLYRKFFKCPNFDGWYHFRQKEVNQKLQALHLEALCKEDLVNWVRDKQEVEIVDLVLRLKDKMISAQNNDIPVSMDIVKKLKCHLHSIISSLPEDLQSVLKTHL
ncbi:protein DENND6A isoform X2 [Lingula anatina]|uniref:Protein DENND6A isoform X2 n=1 Tax=Lingula anatina TaxID=7574 RepID=A0A1S3J3D7_LINAN|nr:protein DENND6A isoform X2 [Lingula anatina]|eukprot:XP_013404768.1 protein DENND6A isoform X2 [Lingula anatina]